MEGPAREINLMDIAGNLEKILCEAEQIRVRATEAGDILSGSQPCDKPSGASTPQPSALLHRIRQSLCVLESVQHEQRQALNRIHNSLQEPPPNTLVATAGSGGGAGLAGYTRFEMQNVKQR
jgi:hypothetical protein